MSQVQLHREDQTVERLKIHLIICSYKLQKVLPTAYQPGSKFYLGYSDVGIISFNIGES